jgi:thiol-disulfide isomerase/thioredoxin
MKKPNTRWVFLIWAWLLAAASACAAPRAFTTASLADIDQARRGKPFVLLLWSLDCASCIKEMNGIAAVLARHPQLDLVMIATDESARADRVTAVLEKHGLGAVDSWVFADPDPQSLRDGIDPSWFGEMPRAYFYDSTHRRTAKSGAVSPEQLEAWLAAVK